MKKGKKIITTIGAVALLLGVMLTPSINAMLLEGKTAKTTTATVEESNPNKNAKSTNYEPLCIGAIFGKTGYLFGWGAYTFPFMLVKARLGFIVVRRDISNFFCNYRLIGLPLGHTYTVTVSSNAILQYEDEYYRFISQTILITLTASNPCANIDFFLETEQIDPPDKDNLNANIYQLSEPMQECYENSQNNPYCKQSEQQNE